MDERSRRVRAFLGALLFPAAFALAGGFPSGALAQSMAEAAKGQKIFFKVCVQCHTLQDKSQASGPGLGGVLKRIPSEEWLMKWLKDPKGMVQSGDDYAQSISKKYPLQMPKLKVMQKKSNRRAIITFLKQVHQSAVE
ncbi:MAG TPA: c-type cytochrome [Gammaproteobacteria bacterium]|nr:c-type cytochrome [Gammaproteobacteria bacterium]